MKGKMKWVAVLLCLLVGLAAFAAIPALGDGASVEWSTYTIEERYNVGETLALPEVTATLDGQTQTARSFVYSPDGNAKEASSVVFDTVGAYTVEFRAEFGGRVYTRSHTVQVGNRVVSTTNPTDTVEYVEDTESGISGLKAVMEQGSVLSINRVVDLRRYSSDTPILEIFITPSEAGKRDFAGMRIQITDAYNSANSVTIDYAARTDALERGYSTVYAGATNSVLKGIYPGDGIAYESGDGRGSIIATSFYGGEYASNSLQVRFGNITNMVYGAQRTDSLTLNGMELSSLIIDTDSASYFSSPFGGFTTGEVVISVTPYNYSGKQATFIISDIAGLDLSGGNFYSDPFEPTIVIDYGDYTAETVPAAIAGKPYKLFSATSDADYGVERLLFRDYYTSSRVELEITDDSFVPERAGNYSLVFRATGNYGNVVERVVPIRVLNENEIPAEDKLINSVEGTGSLSGTAGISIQLPEQSYTGGLGNVQTRVAVRDEAGNETDCPSDYFLPENGGNYTIIFYAEDYSGQVSSVEVPCSVADNPNPVFDGTISLPKYFIAGKHYTLPTWTATQYGEEKQEIEAQITATGGQLDGNTFVPSADSTEARIVYTAVSSSGSDVQPFTVPIVSVQGSSGLDLSKYFATENFTATAENNYISYAVTDQAQGGAQMHFIRELLAEYFNVDFFTADGTNNVQSIDVILQDSIDATARIFLRVSKGENNAASVTVNGKGTSYPVSISFAGNYRNGYFSVGYDPAAQAFTCDSRSFAVAETADGAAFAGFASGKVYLTLSVNGVSGDATVGVLRVNNQILTRVAADTINPQIVTEDFFGVYQHGSEVTIGAAYAADVIDPEITFTLTVLDSDGNTVTATDGTVLSDADPGRAYTIRLDQYGSYSFSYRAADTSGRTATYLVAINVVDDVNPVIRLSSGYSGTVEVGSSVQIKEATVTDNVDDTVEYTVFLKDPTGQINVVEGSASFAVAGRYVLTYFAMDSSGNIATLEYTILAQ